MNHFINEKDTIKNILLTDSYRAKSYVKNFNHHIDKLLATCSEVIGSNFSEVNDFKFDHFIYNKCQAIILEKLDDLDDSEIDDELDDLEDMLYDILGKQAHNSNKKSDRDRINSMLDLTIRNIILNYRFKLFSKSESYLNPWKDSSKILFENSLIYTFTDDIQEMKDIGIKVNKGESKLISEELIGVVGKGSKNDFATGYFRNLASFKNLIFNILNDEKHFSNNPIKARDIIDKVRNLGIKEQELTDPNIKNWVIDSMKRSNRLGSNNDGYFVISNKDDLLESYNRHLESFKGYYKTLERHKKLASKFGIPEEELDFHNKI